MNYLSISFYQMLYFVRTVEVGTYSKASQSLNVTQSTLSKCIQNIEMNLNLQLFIREKNNLIPTESGLSLYREWKKLLQEMEKTVENAHRYMGGALSTIKIGVLNSHKSESYLWEYTEAFRKKYPNVALAVESQEPEKLHRKLIENELDVIFTVRYDVESVQWKNHDYKLIRECPLCACMKTDHPLSGKEAWEVTDLADSNLIMISAMHVPSYNSMLVQLCMEQGFFPNIVYNAQSATSQVYNLCKPNDVFICDRYHVDFNSEHVIARPIIGTKSGVAMVWCNQEKQYLKEFIDMVPAIDEGSKELK